MKEAIGVGDLIQLTGKEWWASEYNRLVLVVAMWELEPVFIDIDGEEETVAEEASYVATLIQKAVR